MTATMMPARTSWRAAPGSPCRATSRRARRSAWRPRSGARRGRPICGSSPISSAASASPSWAGRAGSAGSETMELRRSPLEAASWAVLVLLLLLTLIGALRLDRSRFPLMGDEATYAMQAASLVHDHDLAYTRQD